MSKWTDWHWSNTVVDIFHSISLFHNCDELPVRPRALFKSPASPIFFLLSLWLPWYRLRLTNVRQQYSITRCLPLCPVKHTIKSMSSDYQTSKLQLSTSQVTLQLSHPPSKLPSSRLSLVVSEGITQETKYKTAQNPDVRHQSMPPHASTVFGMLANLVVHTSNPMVPPLGFFQD